MDVTEYDNVVRFHGHRCPGLAIGYRMSKAALEWLGASRAPDDEVVAIVENDACGVDAVQFMTSCTFGKGNLVFHDYGKQVYTFYSRATKKGVRVLFHGSGIPWEVTDRSERELFILQAPAEALLSLTPVMVAEPESARVRDSVVCAVCGEMVMTTRTTHRGGAVTCIPCAEE